MEEKINKLKNIVIEKYISISNDEDLFAEYFIDYIINNIDNEDLIQHGHKNGDNNFYDYTINMKLNTLKLIVGESNLSNDIKSLGEKQLFSILISKLNDGYGMVLHDISDEKIRLMFNDIQAQ